MVLINYKIYMSVLQPTRTNVVRSLVVGIRGSHPRGPCSIPGVGTTIRRDPDYGQ